MRCAEETFSRALKQTENPPWTNRIIFNLIMPFEDY